MNKQLMEGKPQERPTPKYQSIREFAREINVTPGSLYLKFRTGQLPCLRFGKKILVYPPDVIEAMKAGIPLVVNLREVRQHLLNQQVLQRGADYSGALDAVTIVTEYVQTYPHLQRGRKGNGDEKS